MAAVITVDNLLFGNIEIKIRNSEEVPTIKFVGSIDMEYPNKVLDPYFKTLHENILANKVKRIIVDFTDLSFLNSSGIKCFVLWVMKLQGLGADQGYKIDFLLTDDSPWQKDSIKFLLFLVPDLLAII